MAAISAALSVRTSSKGTPSSSGAGSPIASFARSPKPAAAARAIQPFRLRVSGVAFSRRHPTCAQPRRAGAEDLHERSRQAAQLTNRESRVPSALENRCRNGMRTAMQLRHARSAKGHRRLTASRDGFVVVKRFLDCVLRDEGQSELIGERPRQRRLPSAGPPGDNDVATHDRHRHRREPATAAQDNACGQSRQPCGARACCTLLLQSGERAMTVVAP